MARILLVDDEKNLVIMMKSRLEDAGHEILSAYDGLEAIEKVYQEKPDLIILDLVLPKMDGYTVCQKLKSDDKSKEIPIIMLTARGKGLDLERIVAMEFGADAYLTKPFDPKELLSKIKELLGS